MFEHMQNNNHDLSCTMLQTSARIYDCYSIVLVEKKKFLLPGVETDGGVNFRHINTSYFFIIYFLLVFLCVFLNSDIYIF